MGTSFFSRRIGLSNQGTPLPIDAGARLVTQNSKYSLGALAIRQRESERNPASNFGVLRYSRNFSGQSRFGGLATFRNDQSLGNIASHNNFTFTLDGLHRFNQSLSLQAMVSASSDEITGDGLGGQLWIGYSDNLMYVGLLQYYNRSYNPGIGLEILDDNYIMTSPAMNLDLRPDWLLHLSEVILRVCMHTSLMILRHLIICSVTWVLELLTLIFRIGLCFTSPTNLTGKT